jgi:hypothetical protein
MKHSPNKIAACWPIVTYCSPLQSRWLEPNENCGALKENHFPSPSPNRRGLLTKGMVFLSLLTLNTSGIVPPTQTILFKEDSLVKIEEIDTWRYSITSISSKRLFSNK